MNITKYASNSCVKCKVLDRILKSMKLPTDVVTYYHEDNPDKFEDITSLPTLVIEEGDKKEVLTGVMNPRMIEDAISRVG